MCRSTQIKTYSWDNAQVVLAGNKCDMEEERVVSVDSGRLLAEQLGKPEGNIPAVYFCLRASVLHNVMTLLLSQFLSCLLVTKYIHHFLSFSDICSSSCKGFEFFETSAKDNVNVKQTFERLVDLICDKMSDSLDSDPAVTTGAPTAKLTDSAPPLQQPACNC